MFLGPSIEPEKASPKSASTANPPRKVNFIAFLLIIYRVNGFGIISIKFWSFFVPKIKTTVCPQKGAFKAQSQAIYRDLNHDGYIFSRPN
jgi:hypothetical protein